MVIIEVLSDSTRRTDLGEKRDAYLTIPSLKVLIFAESEVPAVIVQAIPATQEMLWRYAPPLRTPCAFIAFDQPMEMVSNQNPRMHPPGKSFAERISHEVRPHAA